MKEKLIRLSLPVVKLVCVCGTLAGLFFLLAGSWTSGLCMLLGAYFLERNLYRCPHCRHRLDLKKQVSPLDRCPGCGSGLRR